LVKIFAEATVTSGPLSRVVHASGPSLFRRLGSAPPFGRHPVRGLVGWPRAIVDGNCRSRAL